MNADPHIPAGIAEGQLAYPSELGDTGFKEMKFLFSQLPGSEL